MNRGDRVSFVNLRGNRIRGTITSVSADGLKADVLGDDAETYRSRLTRHLGIVEEVPIEWWTPDEDGTLDHNSFWAKRAMEHALWKWWKQYQHTDTEDLNLDELVFKVNPKAGTVEVEERKS